MKKIKLILLFVLMPLFSFAQLEDTKFVITDGLDNASLKAAMENNVSLFLKACNVAVMEGDKSARCYKTCIKDSKTAGKSQV